jgi:CheY-like chemotaxis protein
MILTFVGEAVDGRDAVAVVTRTRPDVVLMDVRMPGVDGIAAARKITTDSRLSGVAIIMLTTFDEDDQDLCGDPGRGFRRAVRRKAITSVAFSEWVPGPAISTVMSVLTATTEKLLSTPFSRRRMLAGMTALPALALVGCGFDRTTANPISTVDMLDFGNRLRIPGLAASRVAEDGVRELRLSAVAGAAEFLAETSTPTWGYTDGRDDRISRAHLVGGSGRACRIATESTTSRSSCRTAASTRGGGSRCAAAR